MAQKIEFFFSMGQFKYDVPRNITFLGIIQMRPNLSYINKTTKRKKETDVSHASDDEEAGPSTVEQVTVKFRKPTNDGQTTESTSYKSLQRKYEQENWELCDFYPESSTFTEVRLYIQLIEYFF